MECKELIQSIDPSDGIITVIIPRELLKAHLFLVLAWYSSDVVKFWFQDVLNFSHLVKFVIG